MPKYGKVNMSLGNSKLGKVLNVNLPAILTCRHDCGCCAECYATKGIYAAFPHSTVDKYKENLAVYQEDPAEYWDGVRTGIKAVKPQYFRFHSSGDIPDPYYIVGLMMIVREFPDVKFLIFTKRDRWINRYLNGKERPRNLSIVLSAWTDFIPENPHNLPVAYVKYPEMESEIPANVFHCMGSCANCQNANCWNMTEGDAVYFDIHSGKYGNPHKKAKAS